MFGLITYSLILLVLFIAVWRRPAAGMAAVLCLYGLKQWGQNTSQILVQYRQFTNIAVAIIAMIGVLLAARKRSCLFCGLPPTATLIAALLMYALISVMWAPDPQASLQEWVIQGPYIIVIALLAPLLFTDLDDARIGFIWTALAGAAICVLALAFGKWGSRGLVVLGSVVDDGSGGLAETNPLALSSMAGTVFVIAALSLSRSSPIFLRLAAGACVPIALAVILRSGSRGQLIASGAGLIVGLPIAFRVKDGRSLAVLILIAVTVLGLASWGASFVDIDNSRWADKRTTEDVVGRVANAQALLNLSTSQFSSLIFGLGNSSSFQAIGFYPHIASVEILAEEGIVGAMIYFAAMFFAVRSIKRILSQSALSDSKRNALAVLSGLFVFEFILSWKQGSLLSSVYVFAYAIILGRLEGPALKHAPGAAQTPATPALPRFQNLLR
jgi:hypothetical protein